MWSFLGLRPFGICRKDSSCRISLHFYSKISKIISIVRSMYLLFLLKNSSNFPLSSAVNCPFDLQSLTTAAFSMFNLSGFGLAKLPAANENKTWYSSSPTGWIKSQLTLSILTRTIWTKNINEGKKRHSANYLLSQSRTIHSHNCIKNCSYLIETVSL